MNAQEKKLNRKISELEEGREETEERTTVLEKLSDLEKCVTEVDVQLSRFADFDPEQMEKLKSNTLRAREAANRWVDNIFNCQSWAQKKFSMEKKTFSSQFGIPEELDYIEE